MTPEELEEQRVRDYLGMILKPEAVERVMGRPMPIFGSLTPIELVKSGRTEELLAAYKMLFSYEVPL